MSLPAVHTPKKGKTKRRFKLRALLWLIFGLLFLAAIILFWVWTQRFSIAEKQIKARLAEQGIDAKFSITALNETFARAENVELSDQGRVFLNARAVEANYVWREALEGKLQSVKILAPKVDVEIDKNANPKLTFLDRPSSGGKFSLPPKGVTVENGAAKVRSPYGSVETDISGVIFSKDRFDVALDLQPSEVAYGDFKAVLSGPVKATRQGDNPEYDLALLVPKWSYRELSGEQLTLTGQGVVALSAPGIDVKGDFGATFEKFAGKAVGSGAGSLNWSGIITIPRQSAEILQAKGKWDLSVRDIVMPDEVKRRDMARRLALYDSLSKAPVMTNFAAPMSSSLSDLLKQGSLTGRGTIEKDTLASQLYLSAPLIWRNEKVSITARPDNALPLYNYRRQSDEMTLRFDAELDSRLPLNIRAGKLQLHSTNGLNIKGVKSFEANIKTPKSWFGQTPNGQKVHLRPTSAAINYQGAGPVRNLSLIGKITYDGDIPGGYVSDLTSDGRLDLKIKDNTEIFFRPARNSRVNIKQFLPEAPWIANDLSFDLKTESAKPLFVQTGGGGKLTAALVNLETDLVSEDGRRELHINYGEADLSADIRQGLQNWLVTGRDIVVTSDTMPSVGTVMTTPNAEVTVSLKSGGEPDFTITAPVANVKTNAVDALGLSVKAEGQPDKFRVNYENGRVKFIATEFPRFKMTGYADYDDNVWTGRADSVLPFDQKTPLDIAYSFENGRGIANVEIADMKFSPRGLQPQSFIPALRGKVADVQGRSKARIHLEFEEGQPMTSSGSAELINLNFGTLPGPFEGVNAELQFSSFFPLVTDGVQTVMIKSFDPGFPLPDGVVDFEAVEDGVIIHTARWPIGTGFVSLDPTEWVYLAEENRMTLRVENVSLGEFLGNIGGKNFSATGNVNGVLPVVISGVNVAVEDGRLSVKDGGVIRYRSEQTDAAAEKNEIAGYAFDALKEFKYQELEAIMNGPLDGNLILRILFEGSNPEVLGGAVFKFNVKLEGELLNIARSFKLGDRIAEEVKKAIQASNPQEDLFTVD